MRGFVTPWAPASAADTISGHLAEVVELVDTQRSGRCARKGVRVRFPSSAVDFVAVEPISISLGQYLLREDAQSGSGAGVDGVDESLRAGMRDVGWGRGASVDGGDGILTSIAQVTERVDHSPELASSGRETSPCRHRAQPRRAEAKMSGKRFTLGRLNRIHDGRPTLGSGPGLPPVATTANRPR